MLSFAVTAYEEMSDVRQHGARLLRAISAAQAHESIDEVVIVDDGSSDGDQLEAFLNGQPKVRFYRNDENRGVFGNKLEAIARSTGDWVITCDSDNTMDRTFLDQVLALISTEQDPDVWYLPSFAKPNFDYRSMQGAYDLAVSEALLRMPLGECLMNTGNQTVHREAFMEVFGQFRGQRFDLMLPNYLGLVLPEREQKHWRLVWDACDSFIFNMEWLLDYGYLRVVEGLEYDHYYTSGPESNYARAPVEKEQLNKKLVAALTEASRKAAL